MTNYEYLRDNYKELTARELVNERMIYWFNWYQKYLALIVSGQSKKEARKYLQARMSRFTFYRIFKYMNDEH